LASFSAIPGFQGDGSHNKGEAERKPSPGLKGYLALFLAFFEVFAIPVLILILVLLLIVLLASRPMV